MKLKNLIITNKVFNFCSDSFITSILYNDKILYELALNIRKNIQHVLFDDFHNSIMIDVKKIIKKQNDKCKNL